MLESNVFRTVMMVSAVMTAALIIALVFTVDLVSLDSNEDGDISAEAARYESIMERELEPGQTDITVYNAIWFSVKGMIRGSVQHY